MDVVVNESPSYARRQALRQADAATLKSLNVSSEQPLSKYANLASKLLSAFQLAVDDRQLDEAYVFGLRFSTFSLEVLPRHRDFKNNIKEKRRNRQQVDKVLSMMEIIKQRMDVEEMVVRQRRRDQQIEEKERHEKQQGKHRSEIEEGAQQKCETLRLHKAEEEVSESTSASSPKCRKKATLNKVQDPSKPSVEESAIAKLLALGKTIKKTSSHDNKTTEQIVKQEPTHSDKQSQEIKLAKEEKVDTRSKIFHPSQKKTLSEVVTSPSIDTPLNATIQREQANHKYALHRQKTKPVESKSGEQNETEKKTDSVTSTSQIPHNRPRSKEEVVIMRLRKTIEAQEKRLKEIETVQIPGLLEQAKAYLALDKQSSESSTLSKIKSNDGTDTSSRNRKAALSCMAHKKRLEKESDTIKAAVFNMETQQFMLENILEDREVKKAMDEAARAMQSLHEAVGGDPSMVAIDLSNESAGLTPLPANIEDLDDEDLMEELEEWLTPGEMKRESTSSKRQSSKQLENLILEEQEEAEEDDDEISMLTLPSIPKSPLDSSKSSRKTRSLIPAVF